MTHRFRFSDAAAGDFELPDVEAVLDAVEAALVGPDTPMFDAARQCWQPVARHPEVRAAWAERARFRPPGTGLDLPPLPPERSIPAEGDESAKRRAAYAAGAGRGAGGAGRSVTLSPPPFSLPSPWPAALPATSSTSPWPA